MKSFKAIALLLFLSISVFTQSKTEIPKDWKKFSNDSFSFYAPVTLKKQDVRGIDSFVEEYKNEDFTVEFDYGWYENTAGNCDEPISVSVDKQAAKICFYKDEEIDKEKPFVTAISFLKLGKQTKFTFWVLSKTEALQKEAEKIVRSIEFK